MICVILIIISYFVVIYFSKWSFIFLFVTKDFVYQYLWKNFGTHNLILAISCMYWVRKMIFFFAFFVPKVLENRLVVLNWSGWKSNSPWNLLQWILHLIWYIPKRWTRSLSGVLNNLKQILFNMPLFFCYDVYEK